MNSTILDLSEILSDVRLHIMPDLGQVPKKKKKMKTIIKAVGGMKDHAL